MVDMVASPRELNPWSWGLDALEKFRATLNLDKLPRSENLVATLIGNAQEGKTSLAIRLLGATREEAERLEPVLRGGREYGKSATQVATIYEATGERMTEESLAIIAEEVKRAWKDKPEELRLRLPLKGSIAATVVDLVGLAPRARRERELAKDLAKKWLYLADLLIYVCRADHITDLKPHDPEMFEIMSRWQIDKDTAIFVLTNAYEVANPELKKVLDGTSVPSELFHTAQKALKEKLASQMEIDVNELPLVLPVCLKLDDVRPELLEATEYALKKIADIVNKDPIRFRVRAGFTYPNQLLAEIKRDRRRLDERIGDIERERGKWEDDLKWYRERVNEQEGRIKSIEDDLREIREKKKGLSPIKSSIRSVFSKAVKKLSIPWEDGELGGKVKQLQRMASTFTDEIIKALDDVWKSVEEQIPSEIETELKSAFNKRVKQPLREYLSERPGSIKKDGDVVVRGSVGGFLTGFIFAGLPGAFVGWATGVNWKESWYNLLEWADEVREYALQEFEKGVETHLSPILEEEYSRIEKEEGKVIVMLQNEKKRLEKRESDLESKEKDFRKWRDEIQKELRELEKKIHENERRREEASKFQIYLAEAFQEFWNREVGEINKCNDPVKILNTMAYLNDAREVLEELVTMWREGEKAR